MVNINEKKLTAPNSPDTKQQNVSLSEEVPTPHNINLTSSHIKQNSLTKTASDSVWEQFKEIDNTYTFKDKKFTEKFKVIKNFLHYNFLKLTNKKYKDISFDRFVQNIQNHKPKFAEEGWGDYKCKSNESEENYIRKYEYCDFDTALSNIFRDNQNLSTSELKDVIMNLNKFKTTAYDEIEQGEIKEMLDIFERADYNYFYESLDLLGMFMTTPEMKNFKEIRDKVRVSLLEVCITLETEKLEKYYKGPSRPNE